MRAIRAHIDGTDGSRTMCYAAQRTCECKAANCSSFHTSSRSFEGRANPYLPGHQNHQSVEILPSPPPLLAIRMYLVVDPRWWASYHLPFVEGAPFGRAGIRHVRRTGHRPASHPHEGAVPGRRPSCLGEQRISSHTGDSSHAAFHTCARWKHDGEGLAGLPGVGLPLIRVRVEVQRHLPDSLLRNTPAKEGE